VDRSNPSGLAVLALNEQDLGASGDEVHIQTIIFPVRYDDFNRKVIETALASTLGSVVMVMTGSENSGREFYDVERWAGKRRVNLVPDNNAKVIGTSAGVSDPGLTGKEFLESTLPYELVIVTAADTVSGPQGTTPFVIDQSFQKVGGSLPEPDPGDDVQKKISWYTKRFQDDLSTGNSIQGSGGNYLSNEIFYRVALARGQSTVATGHLHVPSTGTDPTSTGPSLIAGVTEAVRRMLIAVTQPRLRSAASLQFPKTVVSQTRTLILTARNESTETINVESAEVAAPFGVTLAGTTPIAVPPQGTITLNLSFTPTAVEKFFQAVRVKNPDQRFVLACTLMGEGVATAPAPTISDFNPKSGVRGDTTKITGLDFTGATNVRIGTTSGQGVAFTFISDTEIEATVDANARTGRIEVETASGKARSAVNFTVRRPRPPATPFAEELAQRRAELGLTTAQAATQLGTKSGTYRRWERGLDRPSARFHAAIVSFLGHDPDRDPQEFGQQIRAAREGEGLSRGQLALQLGVSSSTVKAWEDGTVSRPSPRVQGIFEDYLNVE
jgi:DNA-binding transcriptional regulator YiaG